MFPYVAADKSHAANNQNSFGKERIVAALLDYSLDRIEIGVDHHYLNVSRLPNATWECTCKACNANFSCEVHSDHLSLLIIRELLVSEAWSKDFFLVALHATGPLNIQFLEVSILFSNFDNHLAYFM